MKTFLKRNIILACLAAAVACSEWTTPESIDISKSSIEDTNPELYRQYCEALKAYKKGEHKITYAAFENTGTISNGSHKVSMLPDSIDFVQMMNVEVDPVTLSEVKAAREKFGTRFILRFSYNDCLAEYETLGNDEAPSFEEYLAEAFEYTCGKVQEYGFDGITYAYTCGKYEEMTSAQRTALKKEQNMALPMLEEWIEANPEMLFFFEGYPHYIIDSEIVPEADYIILPTRSSRSVGDLGYAALQAYNSGKISKKTRFLYAVDTPSFIEEEYLVGQFVLGRQVPLASEWITENESFDKSGLAIWNVQRDYFGTKKTYSDVRRAIKTMNPNE